VFAAERDLPPHVFPVATELDYQAHESWVAACKWSGNLKGVVPDLGEAVGRGAPGKWRGCLDDGAGEDAGRFGWVEEHEHETSGVRSGGRA